MRIDILTLFPEMFQGVLGSSILRRAANDTADRPAPIRFYLTDIRDHSADKHHKVDNTSYGGGPGMVIQCQPIWDAVQAVEAQEPTIPTTRILMTPQGRKFDQGTAERLAAMPRLLILAGHYEGIDERVICHLQPLEEWSIGDYVLTGGEIPAMVLVDAVARLVPGVLGHDASSDHDSFSLGADRMLDYPHYTRPAEWLGRKVPEVLLSGDHARIETWRREQARRRTAERRPDLMPTTSAPTRSSGLLQSAIEAIGHTPLVALTRITGGVDGRILAKLEYLNPGHSKKDRIGRQMIEDAEAAGILEPGQTIVELTSGNTGTGLAIVCRIKGYPFVAVMSKGNSSERARMMSALGAEVVLVDQAPESKRGHVSGADLELVEEETKRIVEQRRAFWADQFRLEGNFRAHYLHTGPEMLKQSDHSIDAFCDFVGSGGTFAGCAAALKQFNTAIQCYVIEPEGSDVLAGQPLTKSSHPIQGGGYAMTELSLLRHQDIDGFLTVTDGQAIEATRRLAREEGIFAGYSSGANVAAALHLLGGPCRGKTVAITINDSGLKYLSTDLWR